MKPFINDVLRNMDKNFSDALKKGDTIDVKHIFGAYTMDAIIQVAFGIKVDSLVEPNSPIIQHARRLFSADMSWSNIAKLTIMFMLPKLASVLKLRLFTSEIAFFDEFSRQIIEAKRAEFENDRKTKKATSFIEFLLEAKFEEEKLMNGEKDGSSKQSKYLSNVELISQCVQFLTVGYDTTATAISMSIYLLATHPQVQEKLFQEIGQIIEKLIEEETEETNATSKDPIELITIEALSCFEYLNAILSETLRLYSPGVFTERQVARDMVLQTEDGEICIHVKKDDIIHFPIYSMHRDPEQFPDPEVFKPERFLDDKPTFHRYAYLPFGAGPRNCVAKSLALIEAKLALLHAVRRYKFSVTKETKIPPEFYHQGQVLIPKEINLKVEQRM